MSEDSFFKPVDVTEAADRLERHHKDVYAMMDELRALRDEVIGGREARKILAELMRRTHSDGPVDGTGFGATGLAVDMTMEVLLSHLDDPRANNFVSFKITKRGEDRAIVTVQRPTGKTPIEMVREKDLEIAKLRAEVAELETARALIKAAYAWEEDQDSDANVELSEAVRAHRQFA